MGKLKTNKSVRKRVRFTKSGKIMKNRAGKRHLLEHKAAKRRRSLRQKDLVTGAFKNQIRRLLPYA